MKEEELQELEEWYLDDGELHELQILKLIDIAKRFNDIQIENAKLSIMLRDTQSHLFDIEQQNKRYRDHLKYMLDEVKDHKKLGLRIQHWALIKDLERALEGDSDE